MLETTLLDKSLPLDFWPKMQGCRKLEKIGENLPIYFRLKMEKQNLHFGRKIYPSLLVSQCNDFWRKTDSWLPEQSGKLTQHTCHGSKVVRVQCKWDPQIFSKGLHVIPTSIQFSQITQIFLDYFGDNIMLPHCKLQKTNNQMVGTDLNNY